MIVLVGGVMVLSEKVVPAPGPVSISAAVHDSSPEKSGGATLMRAGGASPFSRQAEDGDEYGGGVLPGGILLLGLWTRLATVSRGDGDVKRVIGTRTCWGNHPLRPRETYAQELIQANKLLRNRIEEQNMFLEAAAHDLKNPFFGIRALAELILENESLSPAVEHKVTLIRQSAADALNQIDELLRWAAEVEEQKHVLSTLDVGALAQWVTDGFEPQAERKGQDLHCTVVASGECVVRGDRARLREALSNLVSNALKYSLFDARIDVVVERDGDAVRVSVMDEGPGLSDEEQSRLFLPFHRLSPEPTGGESASGLGLYLVRQIVEQHDGQVEVASTPGEGSTFALVLPAVTGDGADA